MRLRVLGSAGGSAPGRLLSGYLIDDVLAVDAGSLTTALDLEAQRAVQAVALTHGHMDHVWTLPFFLVDRLGGMPPTCHILGSAFTLETVQTHLFNERIWLDLEAAGASDPTRVQWHVVEPGGAQQVLDRYELTAIELNHSVPCQAYRIRDETGALIVCGDTTTTDEVWQVADATPDLRGIVIECALPEGLERIAALSKHMTPALLVADLQKLAADVPIHVTHRKPGCEGDIEKALRQAGERRLRYLSDGDEIDL